MKTSKSQGKEKGTGETNHFHFFLTLVIFHSENGLAFEGYLDMPPHNVPLWHEGYIELKATENQQLQEEQFPAFPLFA